MQLKIDTAGVQFRVAGAPRPKKFKDNEPQATTQDGRPIWTVRLDAIESDRQTKETIWVEVAGDEPKLTFDAPAQVAGLVFAPYVSKTGKVGRKFRAEAVSTLADARKSAAA
jgi:hypothetical protein